MKSSKGRLGATLAGAVLVGTMGLGVGSVAKVGASPSKHQVASAVQMTGSGSRHGLPSGHSRPWVGHFDGSVIPGTSNVDGMGHVTDLGSVHFHVQTSLLYSDHVVVVFGAQTVMTAISGESLNATGDLIELGATTPACHGNGLIGESNFTGGTGRFVNATGVTRFFGCIDRTVTPARVTGASYGAISS